MNRSRNLDLIAPDDPVTTEKTEVKVETKVIKKEKKKEVNKGQRGIEDIRVKINEILGRTKHPFSSFLVNPNVFTFQEREEKEEILLVLRRHWFTNISWILITGGMLVLPALLNFVPLLNSFPRGFQTVFILFWYMITFAFT
jgi:hypothetical protein